MPVDEPRLTGARSQRPRLSKILSLLVSAVALGFVLRRYPLAVIVARMGEGRPAVLPPLALGLATFSLLWGALCDYAVVRRLGADVTYGRLARGKAGVAVMSSLGYLFSHGGYGVWLARTLGEGASWAGGLVVFFLFSDLAAVGAIASVALALGREGNTALQAIALALALVQPLAIALGPLLRRAPRGLAAWQRLPPWLGLAQVLGRVVNLLVIVMMTWAAARAFGLAIPFPAMAAYLPIILLVASLPGNVAGFGTAQGAWLFFFTPFADGAKILAFVFLWQASIAVAVIVRGLPFVRAAFEEIQKGSRVVV